MQQDVPTSPPDSPRQGGITTRPRVAPGEAGLDDLLEKHRRLIEDAEQRAAQRARQPTALEMLRQTWQDELIPEFRALQDKYQPKGVLLLLDISTFLHGGRELTITIEFSGQGMRLDGIATDSLIAFRQTRYAEYDPAGLTASGPSLRIRGLTADRFRDFICDRAGSLVRSTMNRRG